MKKQSALIILFLVANFVLAQNNTFRKLYGQSTWLYYSRIIQTDDGGFGIPASTDTITAGLNDYTFLRLDSAGNLLWQKTYGTVNNEATTDACKMSDGGFAITGVALIQNNYRVNVIRIDSAGNLLWSKIIGIFSGAPRFIRETNNGGLILIANAFGGIGQEDIIFIKLDSIGNVLNAKAFGSNEIEGLWSAAPTNDGGVIVIGESFLTCATGPIPYLLKIDSAGNMMWNKILIFGICLGGQGFHVMQTKDGNYIAGLSDGQITAFAKFDSIGNIKWCNTYTAGITELKVVKELSDGYIFADLIADTVNNFYTTFFTKIDTSGNLIWSNRFVDPTDQYRYFCNRFETTPDDYIIIPGEYTTPSAIKPNFLVQKFPVNSIDSICDSQPVSTTVIPIILSLDTGFVEINFPGISSTNFSTIVNIPSFSTSSICIYTGIEKIENTKSISIYPNPAQDIIFIEHNIPGNTIFSVTIYNTIGQQVLQTSFPNRPTYTFPVSIANLPNGLYFVIVGNEKNWETIKIIKQ